MNLSDVYERSPVPVQNLLSTSYGIRELRRRHAGSFARNVRELGVREWWSPEQLALDQASRLRTLVTWCAARIPHYRDELARLGLDPRDLRTPADLELLPLLDKETVRQDPERFLPTGPRPKLLAQTTGGTTGTPLRYWATLDAVRFNYAVYEARSRHWAGVELGQRMASLHGQPIVPAGQQGGPYWRKNLAFNQLYLSVYHLSDANLPAYIQALERFDPQLVVGYTSAVHRIAAHLIERGDIGRIAPRSVMVSSETLLPGTRRDIELAFGCRLFNGYSLGELVVYASECPHGDLHVSTEYGVVELVAGEAGNEIVATGLNNLGMPLLRYRTGDLAEAAPAGSAQCGRGLPCLAELRGRIDDVVRTPEGASIGPAPLSLAFQRVANLRRAQVHQDGIEGVRILLEATDAYGPDDQQLLDTELRRRLGPSLRIDYERVDMLPRTGGGKERLVVSSLGPTSPKGTTP